MVGQDQVSLVGGTASFDNKNVGTAKTVTLTGATLDGSAKGNYTLSSVSDATADVIGPRVAVRRARMTPDGRRGSG